MSAAKAKAKAGDLVEVPDPASVVRPDGVQVRVTGGSYVVNQVGTYVVDGDELEVK